MTAADFIESVKEILSDKSKEALNSSELEQIMGLPCAQNLHSQGSEETSRF